MGFPDYVKNCLAEHGWVLREDNELFGMLYHTVTKAFSRIGFFKEDNLDNGCLHVVLGVSDPSDIPDAKEIYRERATIDAAMCSTLAHMGLDLRARDATDLALKIFESVPERAHSFDFRLMVPKDIADDILADFKHSDIYWLHKCKPMLEVEPMTTEELENAFLEGYGS